MSSPHATCPHTNKSSIKARVFEKNSSGFMLPVANIDLPPEGVGRMAVVYKYVPRGGTVREADVNKLYIFDEAGCLTRIIQ